MHETTVGDPPRQHGSHRHRYSGSLRLHPRAEPPSKPSEHEPAVIGQSMAAPGPHRETAFIPQLLVPVRDTGKGGTRDGRQVAVPATRAKRIEELADGGAPRETAQCLRGRVEQAQRGLAAHPQRA